MAHSFNARQASSVVLNGSSERVGLFLSDPRNLVEALLDPKRVKQIAPGRFIVQMSPIQALNIQIAPEVELDIATDSQSRVLLKAVGCRIVGNDWIDRNFDLSFEGCLFPRGLDTGNGIELVGDANLNVQIGLPPLLQFTPKSIVEGIGNTITRGVLTAIERSLCRQLPNQFQQWNKDHLNTATVNNPDCNSLNQQPV